jgi:hypothetical protein
MARLSVRRWQAWAALFSVPCLSYWRGAAHGGDGLRCDHPLPSSHCLPGRERLRVACTGWCGPHLPPNCGGVLHRCHLHVRCGTCTIAGFWRFFARAVYLHACLVAFSSRAVLLLRVKTSTSAGRVYGALMRAAESNAATLCLATLRSCCAAAQDMARAAALQWCAW